MVPFSAETSRPPELNERTYCVRSARRAAPSGASHGKRAARVALPHRPARRERRPLRARGDRPRTSRRGSATQQAPRQPPARRRRRRPRRRARRRGGSAAGRRHAQARRRRRGAVRAGGPSQQAVASERRVLATRWDTGRLRLGGGLRLFAVQRAGPELAGSLGPTLGLVVSSVGATLTRVTNAIMLQGMPPKP